jgi:small subunit ribosomal protein S1
MSSEDPNSTAETSSAPPAGDAPPPNDAADAASSNGPANGATASEDVAGDQETASEEGAPASEHAHAGESGEAPAKKKRRRKKKHKKGAEEGHEAAPRHTSRPATERAPFHTGEEVFGKVTAVLDAAIMVDLSGKALAIFDRSEMEPDDLVPSPGDRFLAHVLNDGVRGGLVVLTRKPLREEETKPLVEQAAKDGTLVSGLITGVIKGGVEVDVDGLRAFAPASGLDLHPANANFAGLVGTRLDFKVAQYKLGGRDVVVTRRPMLEAEAHERRKQALTLLQEGQVMKGVVRTVVEWGVFVALPDAENLEGLVHISEASHDPRAKLAEMFKPGDEVEVQITKIDDKGKIWLSRKALVEDPWAEAKAKYAPGSLHKARVTRLENFGVFVELEPGLDGLIHISDLSLTRIEHPSELLSECQEIDVVVHHFDARNKKISVHPAPPPEYADEPRQKVAKNNKVQVEVIKAEGTAGLIVRLLGVTGRSARGFIPSGQTGTSRGTDLRKAFKTGTRLEAKIIDIDPRRGEPKLSIRALKEDEERSAHREYRKALQREGGFGTLGDLLGAKLKRN